MCTRIVLVGLALAAAVAVAASQGLEKDVIKTSAGELEITFIGHGSLEFGFAGKVIYVDPFSRLADYTKLPKADLMKTAWRALTTNRSSRQKADRRTGRRQEGLTVLPTVVT